MPRTQPYDPSFSEPIGDNYYMNPRTGEVFDANSNTAYASADELGMYTVAQMQSQGNPQGGERSGNGGALAGVGSAGVSGAGYLGSLGGSGAAASTAGATTGATGVGSSIAGGTMMSNGTVAPMTAGYAGTAGTGAGLGAGAALAAPVIGTPTWMYAMSQSAPNAYRDAEGKGVADGTYDAVKPSNGTDYMAYAVDPIYTPQIMAAIGAAASLFGSSKAKEKKTRKEGGRKRIQELGLMNQDSVSRYNQFDGNQFDIRDYKTQTGNDAYNIDFNSPYDANDVGFLNALNYAMIGGKTQKNGDPNKLISDMTGELYNAGKNSGDIKANNRFYGDTLGGPGQIKEAIAQRWRKGQITAEQRDAGFAATDKEYGIVNTTGGRWEDTAGLNEKEAKRNQEELSKIPKATTKPVMTPASTSATNQQLVYRPGASANPNFKNTKIPKKK